MIRRIIEALLEIPFIFGRGRGARAVIFLIGKICPKNWKI